MKKQNVIEVVRKKMWICFKNLDLKGLRTVKTNVYTPKLVGNLEFRLGSPSGQLLAQVPINGKEVEETTAQLSPQEGLHDVYVVYQQQSGGINIWKRLDLRWLAFGR